MLTWASQNSEDTRIRMVVGNGPDGVVVMEVIFERSVVSSPPNCVKRGIFALALVYLANVFIVHLNNIILTL